jgi:hypothetical protein
MRDGKPVYTGITNNIAKRTSGHGERFDELVLVTQTPVGRGQARAIEEALIVRNSGYDNAIHSISSRRDFYDDAVEWGEAWLRLNGY